ncbi:MAG: alpha/beta hydrolase family protein [Pseudomonadota bacterium]
MTSRHNPQIPDIETRSIRSTFVTEGVSCSATLHVPEVADGKARPGILMVGGWGSVQQALTHSFINRFVAAGYAVMEFDFPAGG